MRQISTGASLHLGCSGPISVPAPRSPPPKVFSCDVLSLAWLRSPAISGRVHLLEREPEKVLWEER